MVLSSSLSTFVTPTRYQTVGKQYSGTVLGSEAFFHLGHFLEGEGSWSDAVQAYQTLLAQAEPSVANPWPSQGVQQLAPIIRPWIEAALEAKDYWASVMLFHRLGPKAAEAYANVIGVTLDVALTGEEALGCLRRREQADVILIDTPGRCPFYAKGLEEIARMENGVHACEFLGNSWLTY